MESEQKFNIYIGLLKADMKTELNKENTIKLIVNKLKNIGVIGLNIESIKGYWNGKPENALKISFINTFNVLYTDIIKVLEDLKTDLQQENILIEQEQVLCSFI